MAVKHHGSETQIARHLVPNENKKSVHALQCSVKRSRQRGITIVEYAVGAALIAAAVLVAFGALGNQISLVLNNIATAIG